MKPRHAYPFEKLLAWQSARELASKIDALTKCFPRPEIYGLTSQVNRAAISVAANLAEGSARTSRKDQTHFSRIAYSSLMELACVLIIAVDLDYLAVADEAMLRAHVDEVSRQLNALRSAQRS